MSQGVSFVELFETSGQKFQSAKNLLIRGSLSQQKHGLTRKSGGRSDQCRQKVREREYYSKLMRRIF
jgi:hypothetical protein